MATNNEEPRRRGRPSKAEEVRRVLAEVGCDPALVDPRRVLASIAGDVNAPPTARVSAAKALLGANERKTAHVDQPAKDKAQPKRVVAQRAAATAGGVGSGWGDDLAWSSGRRPQ